jgi:RES domain
VNVRSGLGLPPSNLEGFPSVEPPAALHRLSINENPWYFSTATATDGGRFDLPIPHGTCYWADTLEGALGEKFLRVPRNSVTVEELQALYHHKVKPNLQDIFADLTSKLSRRFGLNGEASISLDYAATRQWAVALHSAGFRGLRYVLRSDPSLKNLGFAIFSRMGASKRAPIGFAGATQTMLNVELATRLLESMGVAVLPRPLSVTIVPIERSRQTGKLRRRRK